MSFKQYLTEKDNPMEVLEKVNGILGDFQKILNTLDELEAMTTGEDRTRSFGSISFAQPIATVRNKIVDSVLPDIQRLYDSIKGAGVVVPSTTHPSTPVSS